MQLDNKCCKEQDKSLQGVPSFKHSREERRIPKGKRMTRQKYEKVFLHAEGINKNYTELEKTIQLEEQEL